MESTRSTASPLVYNGEIIARRDEMLSLTSMWKAAGGQSGRAPGDWRVLASSVEFADHVASILNAGKSGNDLFKPERGGKSPGTWAHWQIGLAYAKYLSPEFHMWCNTVVRERMEERFAISRPRENNIGGMTQEVRKIIGGIVKTVVHDQLAVVVPGLVEAALLTDCRIAAVEFKPALRVLTDHKVPAKGRRGFSQKVSKRLTRFSVAGGFPIRESRETGRYLFHGDTVDMWLKVEGSALIQAHIASVMGQGVLPFKKA